MPDFRELFGLQDILIFVVWSARPICAAGALRRLAVQSDPLSREEIGALPGIFRQNANRCLKRLEGEGLLKLEYGEVTIIDLEQLPGSGE